MTDFGTYAVSIVFDSHSSEKIRKLQGEFADLTGNYFLIEKNPPPHITLGMFHVAPSKIEKLCSDFSDFADSLFEDFPLGESQIYFDKTDSFKGKVIFLSLKEDSVLLVKKMSERLHEIFLSHFEPAANRNYLPENFFPHIALATKLTASQFERAKAQGIGVPREARSGVRPQNAGGRKNGARLARKYAKPGLPEGKCAQISFIDAAKIAGITLFNCKPYEEIARRGNFPG